MTYLSVISSLFLFVFVVLAVNILHALQTKGSVLKTVGLILVFAVVFTQSSLFWTKDTSFDRKVVKPLETGWPIPFHYEPHPMVEAWEAPSTSGKNFMYSVLINAELWGIGFFFLEFVLRRASILLKPLSLGLIFLGFISLISGMTALNFIGLKISEWKNSGVNNSIPVIPPPRIPAPIPIPSPAP